MKKLILTLGLVAAVAISATAQTPVRDNFGNNQVGTFDRVTRMGPYLTGRFSDNWFIGIAGGVNLYNGNDNAERPSFSKRLAPAADFYLGKWVTPDIGIRVGYNGLKAKSANPVQPATGADFRDLSVMFVHADLLWNLSNAAGGFRFDRTWNLVPFAGVGYARSWEGDFKMNRIAVAAGLLNNIRLGDVIDLTIEGRWMLVDGAFDGFGSANKFDNMFSLTAGLTFKLGPKGGFQRPVYTPPTDCTPYIRRIEALESDLEGNRSIIERLNRELQDERNRPAQEVQKVFAPVTITSFFGIGNTQISARDRVNIRNAAETMKAMPAGTMFNVRGYADDSTGSTGRNQYLSEQRAKNVADILVEYGVSRSQLNITGMGGVRNNPTDPTLDRRVNMVVIE